MPSLRKTSPKVHPDESRAIEAHQQTHHKLDVMRRYFGQYPSILIEAAKKSNRLNVDQISLVDAFAGAGLHLSADHMDGVVPGTALQACYQARRVQMKYSRNQINVRLIDNNAAFCTKLLERTAKFREAHGFENVDVKIIRGDVKVKVEEVLRGTQRIGGYSFSLWFFDPYGVKAITRDIFEPLLQVPYGPEIIINLDVSGLFRIREAALTEKADEYEIAEIISAADRKLLSDVYSGQDWESVYGKIQPRGNSRALKTLADCYAETFSSTFRYRSAYPLRSSRGQIRYLIHLTRSRVGAEKFAACYKASLRIGILTGNRLDGNARARIAAALFDFLKGADVTIDAIHEAQLCSLNKGQLRTVLFEAYDLGYGRFDGHVMHWFAERQEDARLQEPLGILASPLQQSLFDVHE
jgi:three-Cys-motif partner protein